MIHPKLLSMKNYFSSSFTLGIVGGGQLGKMLLQETRRLDIRTHSLDPSPVAPCRIGSHQFTQGSLTDYDTVMAFGQACDVLTIEIENVNTRALAHLAEAGKKVYPQPHLVEMIQSKIRQKEFYQKNDFPTADFQTFPDGPSLKQAFKNQEFVLPAVWKIDRGGFDGRGVQMLKKAADLENLPDAPALVEKRIPFERELAVVVARSASGQMSAFPTVEMDFHPEAHLVEYVFSPGEMGPTLSRRARELACAIAEKLGIVGVLAVEMFVTHTGELLINEVAPRVHNSGHLSIEGNYVSQFEQHLRAILDLPLGATDTVQPAVMVNLVGEPDAQGPVQYQGIEQVLDLPGTYVHLYGKAETRPYRKMGHITVLAPELAEARRKARLVKENVKVTSL